KAAMPFRSGSAVGMMFQLQSDLSVFAAGQAVLMPSQAGAGSQELLGDPHATPRFAATRSQVPAALHRSAPHTPPGPHEAPTFAVRSLRQQPPPLLSPPSPSPRGPPPPPGLHASAAECPITGAASSTTPASDASRLTERV